MTAPTRAPIAAQKAMRAAVARALAANLTQTDLRVFVELVALLPLYDRTEDRIANRQLADATGVDPRHVRRSLHRLTEAGVIEREPGRSQHQASLIRFPDSDVPEGAEVARPGTRSEGARSAPAGAVPEGAGFDIQRGQVSTSRGGAHAPASEVLSEASSEGGAMSLESAAASLVPPEARPELAGMLARLTSTHQTSAVASAMGVLQHRPDRYRFVSQLRAALEAEIREVANRRAAELAERTRLALAESRADLDHVGDAHAGAALARAAMSDAAAQAS